MRCEQVQPLLIELEYGTLPALQKNAVDEHLSDCDACREEFESCSAGVSLLNVAAGETKRTESEIDLGQVFWAATTRLESGRRRTRRTMSCLALAAVILMAFFVTRVRWEVREDAVSIAWGNRAKARSAEVAAEPGESSVMVESRLDDLDRLVHLLVQVVDADRQKQSQTNRLLLTKLRSLDGQSETRWRTVRHMLDAIQRQRQIQLVDSQIEFQR